MSALEEIDKLLSDGSSSIMLPMTLVIEGFDTLNKENRSTLLNRMRRHFRKMGYRMETEHALEVFTSNGETLKVLNLVEISN